MNEQFAKKAYHHFWFWGILASLETAVSTIVDALCVGNFVGPMGLPVVNIATPVFLVFALFGIMIGVGSGIPIGRALGAGDVERANRIFHSQLTLALAVGLLCMIPLLFREAFFSFLGVTEELLPYAEQYLTIALWSAPICVIYYVLAEAVRVDSDPIIVTAASATVIVANILLDLLFMWVLPWGMLGASASLGIANLLGTVVLLLHFLRKRALLRPGLGIPRLITIGQTVANGFGIGSSNLFQAITIALFNVLLLRFGGNNGAIYVACYSMLYTVSMLPFALLDGACGSLMTVCSLLLGEEDVESVLTVKRRSLLICSICGVSLALLVFVFPAPIAMLFGLRDPGELAIVTPAIRVFAISFLFVGINMSFTAYWQAIGKARLAAIMSLLRNFFLLLVFGLFLLLPLQLVGLALAYACTELLCTVVSLFLMRFSPDKKHLYQNYVSGARVFSRYYTIEEKSMVQISSDLERVCAEWEMMPKQSFLINFICEELLLNIIKFGMDHREESTNRKKYYIDIRLVEREGGYVLRIRDNVSAFNPFEAEGDEIDLGVLALIRKKAKHCEYQRKMIFNYLYTVI